MNVESLQFLAQPAFVIPWYGVGAVAGIWILSATFSANTDAGPALQASWPIFVLFFPAAG